MSRAQLLWFTVLLLIAAARGQPRAIRWRRLAEAGCPQGNSSCSENAGDPEARSIGAASLQPKDEGTDTPKSNSLCDLPQAGEFGAFTPIAATSVPEDYGELVAKHYLRVNKIKNKSKRKRFVSCPEFSAVVTEACSQIVAGTNFQVLVEVFYCKTSRSLTGGWNNVTLEAQLFKPLPYLNEPANVTDVSCSSCPPPAR